MDSIKPEFTIDNYSVDLTGACIFKYKLVRKLNAVEYILYINITEISSR